MPNVSDYLAAALRDGETARRVKDGLASELVNLGPSRNRIAEFLAEFVEEHGTTPNDGDWEIFLEGLPEQKRKNTAQELGKLRQRNVDQYTPEYLAEHAVDTLRKKAADVAAKRLYGATKDGAELGPADFDWWTQEIQRVGRNGTDPHTAGARNLGELLEEGVPPLPLGTIPRLAWPGMVSLLAAREKLGKTEFLAAGIAAADAGREFLGKPGPKDGDTVLYVHEDPVSLLLRRFKRFEADGQGVELLSIPRPNPIAAIRENLERRDVDLLVIDPLDKLAHSFKRPDSGSSKDWNAVMGSLRELLTEHPEMAILVAHHRPVNTERWYRDSTAIGGSVDMLLKMEVPGRASDPTETPVREIEARGRFELDGYKVMRCAKPWGQGFKLLEGGQEDTLRARILEHVRNEGPVSLNEVRSAISGVGNARIDDALEALEREEKIRDHGDSRAHAYAIAGGDEEPALEVAE